MSRILKILIILIIIFCAGGYVYYLHIIDSPADMAGNDARFIIYPGETVGVISGKLENAGLIRSGFWFEWYAERSGLESDFKAGEYILSPVLTSREIVGIFVVGQTVNRETTIKIIEGWDIEDIDDYLSNENIVPSGDFSSLAGSATGYRDSDTAGRDFLRDVPTDASLEGYLFPDTYRIYNDASANDILEKMLDNFDNRLTGEMRSDIAERGKTIHEIIIMASIIEKEVRSPDDMDLVSGIFWNRIRIGQALQTDATLTYILDDETPGHSIEETTIDSPYNTYKYAGLPPGPICSPGLNAIRAAIYPEETDYGYFLNRQDTGETIFSRTYEEHLRNKVKYLK